MRLRAGRWPAVLAGALLLAASPSLARVEVPRVQGRSVYDLAGVIAPDEARIMERRHTELFERTGVAVVVVIVPRLEGEPIEDFAVRIGAEWGVGRKGEDRGVVVALAIEERRVFIATGYGVEGFLTDGRVGSILDRDVIPLLKRGDDSAAMAQASAALVDAAARQFGITIDGLGAGGPARGDGGTGGSLPPSAALLMLLAIVVLGYLFLRHPFLFWLFFPRSGWGGGYRGGGFSGGFGGNSGFGGFGGGGFGGGGAGRGF